MHEEKAIVTAAAADIKCRHIGNPQPGIDAHSDEVANVLAAPGAASVAVVPGRALDSVACGEDALQFFIGIGALVFDPLRPFGRLYWGGRAFLDPIVQEAEVEKRLDAFQLLRTR